jgi:hypothetical protein
MRALHLHGVSGGGPRQEGKSIPQSPRLTYGE